MKLKATRTTSGNRKKKWKFRGIVIVVLSRVCNSHDGKSSLMLANLVALDVCCCDTVEFMIFLYKNDITVISSYLDLKVPQMVSVTVVYSAQ